MRYGGIYLYILYSFKRDVVMSPTNPILVLPKKNYCSRCPLSISLVYTAAKP
ncbi:hypothetical protein immuto35A_143 [Flavobacterium phage vB_FspM_immuto_3-5A]|uniref:Uncharacterized protein n=1 Tax=Flavobacterium phage vB_FspM_immuto_2-6A TaxID=2801477 RepID=A0A7T8ERL6_9CAUD|nr:hypothetical protein KNV73_gp127 [Flavobacterium phage vB_FspM_immuto_2-6A]QQO91823.1 hypothetical protein immuto26A_144 [Flavobacterium phage vB_FspM_immuto_2-6A]QQO92061.1 hypothetical protein immuto35A_143 [Flavobacterium phage vB_FspM_immuto_3-5A]